jgi:hypothetical protein
MNRLVSYICRILFMVSSVLAGIAVLEKIANTTGFTITKGLYPNWQLLEFSAIILLFVIALQLREIRITMGGNKT